MSSAISKQQSAISLWRSSTRNQPWADGWLLAAGGRFRQGFTLVELVLVIIIIGVLGAAILPRFVGRTEQAKVARGTADIAAIGLALDLYELDVGRYPEALDGLVAKDPPSDFNEAAKAKWNGPYLKKGLPKDPWGRPYEYRQDSQHGQDYDLFSLGPDGKPGNDDIATWE